jgi:ketosteroid isomerase-like protein
MRLVISFFFAMSFALHAQTPKEEVMTLTQTRSELIRQIFNDLRATNTEILKTFYAEDIVFEDPLGQINGLSSMQQYYQAMYKNVQDIRFEFKEDAVIGERHLCVWVMYLRAEGLNGGEEVSVHGVSEIEFQSETTLAIYHRDFFDMGEFLYEHVPVLGSVVRLVKKQLEFKPSLRD